MHRTSNHLLAPAHVIGRRRHVALAALDVLGDWGYREIEVPLLDHYDSLRRALHEDQINRSFRLVDRDGNLLILRADVTPAIAKAYALQLADAPLPLRVCYACKVVRIERAFTRETIESYQIGVELIGVSGTPPEVEVILAAVEVLAKLGIEDYEINLGNAAIVDRLISLAEVDDPAPLLKAIDQRDSFAVRELTRHLPRRHEPLAHALEAVTDLSFNIGSLDLLRAASLDDDTLHGLVDEFEYLLSSLERLGIGDRLHLDMGQVNALGYYTGTLFKIVSERVGRVLGGGGRYDELIGRFGSRTPAVGFSLNLEALLELITWEGDSARGQGNAIVSLADDWVDGFKAIRALRESGESVVVDYSRLTESDT